MIKLFGKSQIMKKDELLAVIRVGDRIGNDVVYKGGKPVQIGHQKLWVRADVQPVEGFQLLLVPEGDRFREQYFLYFENLCLITDQGLEVQAETTLQLNDQVIRLGVNFTVQAIQPWGSYCRARIMRIDVGPNQTPNP